MYVPAALIVKQEAQFRDKCSIETSKLFQATITESIRDWKRIQTAFAKGHAKTGRKQIAHTLRMLVLATQLAEHHTIVNFGADNDRSRQLLHSYDDRFESIRDEYGTQAMKLATQLSCYCKDAAATKEQQAQIDEALAQYCSALKEIGCEL